MKKILLILLITTLTSCKKTPDSEKLNYDVELTYIDGYKDTVTYRLPIGSEIDITSRQGSYFVKIYSKDGLSFGPTGVIRVKIIKVYP